MTTLLAGSGRTPGSGGITDVVSALTRRSPRYGERAVETLLFLAAVASIFTTIGIVLSLMDGLSLIHI